MSFELDKILAADTFFIGKMQLCRVHLMNNAIFPWLILIPEKANLKEIIDLNEVERFTLMSEICAVSEAVQKTCEPDKLNVANLGNVSPQLHVHIIARFKEDPCWPDPVWGRGKPKEIYDEFNKKLMFEKILGGLSEIKSFKPV